MLNYFAVVVAAAICPWPEELRSANTTLNPDSLVAFEWKLIIQITNINGLLSYNCTFSICVAAAFS